MSLLDSIIAQPTPSAPKGIIYGPPMSGKTTFGAHAAHSVIVDCENGAGAVRCNRTPYLCTWPEIAGVLRELAEEPHEYQAVAVDSLDWLLRRIEEHVAGSPGRIDQTLNRSHGGYGNGKQVMRNHVYQWLLPILDRIVNRGVAVLLLTHARRTDITDVDGITTEKCSPDLPEDYLNTFVEWSDFVCLARRDDEQNHWLVTQETPRALAKNRYNLPATLPLDWQAFTHAIGQGLSGRFQAPEPAPLTATPSPEPTQQEN